MTLCEEHSSIEKREFIHGSLLDYRKTLSYVLGIIQIAVGREKHGSVASNFLVNFNTSLLKIFFFF